MQALRAWIRTSATVDGDENETDREAVFQDKGTEHWPAWEILCMNAVLDWPIAGQCVSSTEANTSTVMELADPLCCTAPQLAGRTRQDAFLRLVGLVQHALVRFELGLGEASFSKSLRTQSEELRQPSWKAICHPLRRLFTQTGGKQLGQSERLRWPWLVLDL